MKLRTRTVRRASAVLGALGIAAALLVVMPAGADHELCTQLRAQYVANPEARTALLPYLQRFNCGVPPVTSTSTSSTTSTSIAVTTTTISRDAVTCASLQQQYIANPSLRASLLPVLLASGCTVPPVATTTTQPPGTTTSSSTTSSTSSSTTSSTAVTTTTTINVNASTCAALRDAYRQTDDEQARALLAVELARFNCGAPPVV